MKIRSDYRRHRVALTALCLMGSAVIGLPYNGADDKTFLGFLLTVAVSFPLLWLLLPLCERVFAAAPRGEEGRGKRCLRALVYGLTALLAFGAAAAGFSDYVRFAAGHMLPGAPAALIALAFLLLTGWLCTRPDRVLLKLSLLFFVLLAATVVLFFGLSFPQFRFDNIVLSKLPPVSSVATQAVPYLLSVLLPAVVIPVYQTAVMHTPARRQTVAGLACGWVLLAVCLLNSVLLFGAPFAAGLDFPYASAISTITVGNLFTRMDGFSYFLYFVCCLIKIAVCLAVVGDMLRRLHLTGQKQTVWAACGLLFILSFFL